MTGLLAGSGCHDTTLPFPRGRRDARTG
jgi:hypothetical protein